MKKRVVCASLCFLYGTMCVSMERRGDNDPHVRTAISDQHTSFQPPISLQQEDHYPLAPASNEELKAELRPFFHADIIPIVLGYAEPLYLAHSFTASGQPISYADFEGQRLIVGSDKRLWAISLTETDAKKRTREQAVYPDIYGAIVRQQAMLRAYDGKVHLPPFERLPLGKVRAKSGKVMENVTAMLNTDKQFIVGHQNGCLYGFDMKTGEKVLELKAHNQPIVWVGADSEGKRLVSATESSVKVWHYPSQPNQESDKKEAAKVMQQSRSLKAVLAAFWNALSGS